ncbi:enoyl-CoA hydratase-related protein [Sphingopyxis macrogoltabida]|uniref:Enoyl-CoA hydratase n=1 Tax=Sphingopyxis macrogoltabida TaxID=33050 RepID=A0AAC9FHL0_SPHMC|nr:enoyl-CoA hydratase-related protein [Sphingopyxis macrogoltabida]ALJ16390.1 enoyl-CoA hydratase [Sphingopyxis macrogoltabida]AMU92625.1 enoyl-CoA hydratase [Sphingopyxis macrogoltabida]
MSKIGLQNLKRFEVGVEEGVALVTITHPPVNAQDHVLRVELVRVFDILGETDAVRSIVFTGAGTVFSAGADLSERNALEGAPGGYARHNRLVRSMLDSLAECPKPVIAAMNGAAVGGGAVLALLCDILIVAEESFLAMTEIDHGMSGGVRHLIRSFGASDARLAIFTGERITGLELLRMNVASACVPRTQLLDYAREIAATIARKPPLAVEAAKRSFGLTEDMTLRDGYRYEQSQTASLARTEDTREAALARAEKRNPKFNGR